MLKEDLKDITSYTKKFDIYDETKEIINRLLFQIETYEEQIGKKVKVTDYKLKGWDYEELLEKFNQKQFKEVDHESSVIEDICSYNQILHFLQDNYENEQVVKVIKEYLYKLIGDKNTPDHYDAVWTGMLNIKSNFVFMQFVFALLSHMWN